MSQNEVIEKVREMLARNDFQGASIQILEQGVREEDETWYVPVQPSFDPQNTSRYYEALASIEAELLVDQGTNVLFIPVDPEELESA